MNHDYQFVTHWKIRGDCHEVFAILKDGANYARWWQPAYQESKLLSDKKVISKVRAKLPYTLRFMTELVREDPPWQLEIRVSGELVGTGLWTLSQHGPDTKIEFHWNVRAEKRLVRWFSPFLKPLFRWNHNWVMSTGEEALQIEINKRNKKLTVG
ncbi:MAG: SRPBCC family protein [Deltaproteobacteria bacterium]|nr:SRPBCC family protein [Deltaproteobacteria bacterium]